MPIVYLIFILLAAYFSFRYDGIEEYEPHKNHRYWLLCVYLICLAGFSYALGGDKQAYMFVYDQLNPELSYTQTIYYSILFQGYMPGWSSLMMWVKRTFDSFYALQFIHALIVNVSFCLIVQKYTKRVFLFMLLYIMWSFFTFNTEVMRESLAICCGLFAMESYMNGNRMRFFVLLVVALLFHVSALILLAFPFFEFKMNRKILIIAFCVSFAAWVLSGPIMSKVILAVLGTAGALSQKIMHYGMMASTFFGFARNVITNLIFPFIIMYFSYEWEQDENLKARKRKIISFFIIIGIAGSAIGPFARFRNYIEIYYLAMFADFVYMLLRTKSHLIIRSGVLVGTIFLVTLNYFKYIEESKAYFYEFFVPYTSILDEDVKIANKRTNMHNVVATDKATDKNKREIEE